MITQAWGGAIVSHRFSIAWLCLLALSACDEQSSRNDSTALAALGPADVREAKLYEQSCKACHANPRSGAPLVHDHAQWDPRWAKGMPVLLNHAVLGFQAMPAGGQCAACTAKDDEALIRFMADREGSQ